MCYYIIYKSILWITRKYMIIWVLCVKCATRRRSNTLNSITYICLDDLIYTMN